MTILSVEEFRTFAETALEDDPLQVFLDAAEAEIVRSAGPGGQTTELFGGGLRIISLSRPADSIDSITETIYTTVDTLAADDYLLYPGGYLIERLQTGTNGRWRWWGRVAVTYTPADEEALRKAIQVDLVKLALSYSPGLTSTTIGSWTEQYQQAIGAHADERDSILARLAPHPMMVVVG